MNIRTHKKLSGLGRWTAIAIGIYTAVHVGQRLQNEGLTEPGHRAAVTAVLSASAPVQAAEQVTTPASAPAATR